MSQRYLRPPIIEAVIELRFDGELEQRSINDVAHKLRRHYADVVPQANVNVNLNIVLNENSKLGQSASAQAESRSNGFRLSSTDQAELLILSPLTFAASCVAPYPGWGALFSRFKRDWQTFRDVMGPRKIIRVGLRYINRIDIPHEGEVVEEAEYLTIYPTMPSIFDIMDTYFVQVSYKVREIGCSVGINTGLVEAPILDHSSLILDIDLSKTENVPQSPEKLYELMDQMREWKNNIFESCITDKSRGLFQ